MGYVGYASRRAVPKFHPQISREPSRAPSISYSHELGTMVPLSTCVEACLLEIADSDVPRLQAAPGRFKKYDMQIFLRP
jgi:hypothetical protein